MSKEKILSMARISQAPKDVRFCSREAACYGQGWWRPEETDPVVKATGRPRHYNTCPDCRAKAREYARRHYNSKRRRACLIKDCEEKMAYGMPFLCEAHEEEIVQRTLEARATLKAMYRERLERNVDVEGKQEPGSLTPEAGFLASLPDG